MKTPNLVLIEIESLKKQINILQDKIERSNRTNILMRFLLSILIYILNTLIG